MTQPEPPTSTPLIIGCIAIGAFAIVTNTMDILSEPRSIGDGVGILAGLVLLYHGVAQSLRALAR